MNGGLVPESVRALEQAPPTEPSILIVDDNAANLLAFEAILTPLGHRTVKARSAEDALRQLLQRDFALILLDVQMPEMNGFELAALLKSHSRLAHVPIIFVTALNRDDAHVFKGYSHGAVDYLLKPFDPEMLRVKVNVFIELHRRQETIRRQTALLHQHELRELERRKDQRFHQLTEAMPLPMWSVTATGEVSVSNRAWSEYSGLRTEQTGSFIDARFVHPRDIEAARARWQEGTRAAEPFDAEWRLLRDRDNAYRWHLLRAVPQQSGLDSHGQWIVTATDIHAQRTAEEERSRLFEQEQRAREAAEATNRMKDEFLANVSHELRTPLNAILGWARMLRMGMLGPGRLPDAIATIERSAQAQARLVDDMLDVSRIVNGKLRLQLGPVDLAKVVLDAVETVRPMAETKGVALAYEKELADPSMVGDASRLQQVVWNLISNAVKFTPKGGRVEVRLTGEAGTACITVKDTGIGMSPELLPHVFERFRQGDGTTTRPHDGLGLGLAIVRHLIELHKGHVRAESAGPGEGSTFTVTLPVGLEARDDDDMSVFEGAAGQPVVTASVPPLEGLTVLYVDDQPDARELVEAVLSHYGARVVTVSSAEEAFSIVRTSCPHVLVSDIGLPDTDGYALIRRVRALESKEGNIPAIALTAYARPEDRLRAKDEGFQMHLAKPVEPLELVALVKSLVAPR
ncbi:MAG: response regulator [Myxococcota bacterium]|nr:response regulator [Myxococcota bacterium]